MSILYEKAIVQKRNVLNELRSNNMTLQELRFFSIYLSKINPRDVSTRVVRFPLSDFQKIMELGTDMNISHFKLTVRRILQQIVEVPNDSGSGYRAFQLFKEAVIEKDENDEWYVEFDAHDKALPLMFEFKNKYFKYELWNALRLKSSNQIRMYEILKQYEAVGKREISITELRKLLGVAKNEYSGRTGWSDFKKKVLDSCQQALKETTDICYTYKRGKVGKGGKWLTIVFYIRPNHQHKSPITLDEFMETQSDNVSDKDNKTDYGSNLADLLGDCACDNEFTSEQIRVIQDLIIRVLPPYSDPMVLCDYLIQKVHKMNYYQPQSEKRFAYLCKMIESDISN